MHVDSVLESGELLTLLCGAQLVTAADVGVDGIRRLVAALGCALVRLNSRYFKVCRKCSNTRGSYGSQV